MGSFYNDVETGWYYLNSRYYNPEIGRFINADGLISSVGDILGHNMYTYCQNNPVMRTDRTGMWFGLDDIFTGLVDEIIVLGALACGVLWIGAELGVPGASDALDTVGGWVDSSVQKLKNTAEEIKNKAKSAMFILALGVYADLKDKTSPGTYVISFGSDKYYVGKGPRYRIGLSTLIRTKFIKSDVF